MTEPCELSAIESRRLIGEKKLSPVELLESCLQRIETYQPAINAMAAMDTERARAGAKAAEAAVMRGDKLGALHGLPVGIKDLDPTAGLRTTWGSPIFRDHVPTEDAGMVARIKAAGGIVIGKTNVPEFGLGANTRNTVFGATGNPFDNTRSAAGSSGGSAAALAVDMAPICSGSDTGGSLRNPAAFCGVVGFRPSAGLVSSERRPHGWSCLPVVGPMGRDVADTALLLSVQAGDDARDPLSYTLPGEPVRGIASRYHPVPRLDLASLRLAFSEDFGSAPTENLVREAFRLRVAAIAPLFARAEAAHPDISGGDEVFEVLRAANVLSSHLEKSRSRPQDCGPNLIANVEEGLRYSLADYAVAAQRQTEIYRNFLGFFEQHDVLVTPGICCSPRSWRELYPAEIDGKPTRTYFHWLSLSYYVTIAGHPALCLPMGKDARGMPFGLQIVGPRGGDALVLGVALAIEQACAGDALLARPKPDLAALRAATPISAMEGFLGFG
jgi:Asp-tRNA(Asn)/Glu-tRNA(Gln) amidotransferase A subunit family amidase